MKNDNKLIAEFMGAKPLVLGGSTEYEMYGVLDCIEDGENEKHYFIDDEMRFHESWDWLMPVVEKIERQYKTNFIIKCIWNEFNECSYYQVIVTIEQGEMSKDRSCIYDSKKIYDYIGDTSKCKKEATYEAVVEFIKLYKLN